MEVEFGNGYYDVLGVNFFSSDDEIRRSYRKLAMQWHPDKWIGAPSLADVAKEKFQQIQEAYSVLSDRRRRILYDAGVSEEEDEVEQKEEEGFCDFVQEMASLVNDVRKEEKTYSFEEVQSMFWEMARGYDIPQWCQQQNNSISASSHGGCY